MAKASANQPPGENLLIGIEKEGDFQKNQGGWCRQWESNGKGSAKHSSPPQDLQDPMEVAKWALRQAALYLQVQHKGGTRPRFTILFVWEHPTNPRQCMSACIKVAPGHGSLFYSCGSILQILGNSCLLVRNQKRVGRRGGFLRIGRAFREYIPYLMLGLIKGNWAMLNQSLRFWVQPLGRCMRCCRGSA